MCTVRPPNAERDDDRERASHHPHLCLHPDVVLRDGLHKSSSSSVSAPASPTRISRWWSG